MPKFTFERIKAISAGKYKILQLEIDGVKQLDAFGAGLKGTGYETEYIRLIAWLDYYCKSGDIPNGKMKELSKRSGGRKEFEFRTTNLRFYAVEGETGKIIILCGYKKNQPIDLNKFREMKKHIFQVFKKP